MDGAMDRRFEDGNGREREGRDRWRRVLSEGRRRAPRIAGHAARVTVWGIVHFAFGLAQQLAELLAPLLFVVGAGWFALPRVLGLIQTGDGQMQDILNGLQDHVPSDVTVGGHLLTPGTLVVDGLVLMAVAAALSTASALLARELYRR